MHVKHRLITELALIILLAGCQVVPAPAEPTASPTPPPAPTATPSPSPSPQTSPTPSRTPLPPPVPSPTVPSLNPGGPWLWYKVDDEVFRLCSLDGATCTTPVIPPSSRTCHAMFPCSVATRGGLLLYQVFETETAPQLWIVQLPDQKIIRRIELISEAAQAELPEQMSGANPPLFYYCATSDFYNAAFNFRWSPDGRYLAFSAAQDGAQTDIFLYDTASDAVEQQTGEPENAWIMGWSPGGEWLIYETVAGKGLYDREFTQVAAINLNTGAVAPLYRPSISAFPERIAGWINPGMFLSHSGLDAPVYLRLVDLAKPPAAMLYPGSFSVVYTYPEENAAFLVIGEGMEVRANTPPGLYRLDVSTGEMALAVPGVFMTGWSDDLQRVVIYDYDGIAGSDRMVNADGSLSPLPPAPTQAVYPSPDGRWQIVVQVDGAAIHNGDILAATLPEDPAAQILWLDDSSGFYWLGLAEASTGRRVLQLYLAAGGWQPVTIASPVLSFGLLPGTAPLSRRDPVSLSPPK